MSHEEINNLERAKSSSVPLWKEGYRGISPHGGDPIQKGVWAAGYLDIIPWYTNRFFTGAKLSSHRRSGTGIIMEKLGSEF